MHYRREIDGLRAVAVVPVILFHAGFTVFSGGYVGVDVFFVISGYLITSIILSELEQDAFSILRFYERRARRILPALAFVILCCIPFAWHWMLPVQLKDFSQSIAAVTLFASNFLFWRESGYFSAAAEEKPLLHTWSLAVEEQFYVLFPVLLIVLWRFGRAPVFYCILGLSILSFLLSEWGWRNAPLANFYLAPMRAWELLAGSLCAFLQFGKPQKSNELFAALGLSLIVFAIFHYDANTPFPSAYALAPVAGTALIILYGAHGTKVAQLLSLRAFVGIGLISYSAYLWHQPLFAFARLRHLHEPAQALMMALALTSLGLAYCSWRYIEQPFRAGRTTLLKTQTGVFITAAVAGAVLLGTGVLGHLRDGFPDRMNDMQKSYLATALPSPRRDDCHVVGRVRLTPEQACTFLTEDASVVVFGDSHVVELAYALGQSLAPHNIGIRQLSHSACRPVYEPQDPQAHCAQWIQQSLDFIAQTDSVTDVVVSFRITEYMDTEKFGNSLVQQTSTALLAILERLEATNKNIIYVMQAPELNTDIGKFIALGTPGGMIRLPAARFQEWVERRAPFDALIAPHLGTVTIYDPTAIFCNDVQCFAGKDGTSYYFDDDHLSLAGAGLISDDIAERVMSQR